MLAQSFFAGGQIAMVAIRLRVRRKLTTACSSMVVALGSQTVAFAQNAEVARPAAPNQEAAEQNVIIVIGVRSIVSSLKNVPVEQVYDKQSIDSYGASTVGELLDQIRKEKGDANPALLINGQPVPDAGNISDIPVEAIARVETLPRGSAQRVNGAAGQRAYNIVLRNSVKSVTLTVSHESATEGGWSNNRGEALATYIKGQDRIGLTLRGSRSDTLFENERDFIPQIEMTPYSLTGNIIPAFGAEVDPVLTALVGQPVTAVGLFAGDSHPTLVGLVSGANRINPSSTSAFRSLRGSSRPYEAALAGNKVLASWLSIQFNGRLAWSDNESFSGLPSARFLIPSTSPFTPFSDTVFIALNDPTRPLRSRIGSQAQSVSSALNATFGEWRATQVARWGSRQQSYRSDLIGSLAGGPGTVDPATNPFGGSLAGLIPVTVRESRSENRVVELSADAEGPLFRAWAGAIRARFGVGASWLDYKAADFSGSRSFDRHEYIAKAGITIPLTDRAAGFLPMLGDSQLSFDFAKVGLGRFGTLTKYSAALEWQIAEWLRFAGSRERDELATAPEFLAAPQVINVNVPYFDPETSQTVSVTTIYGGAAGLRNEDLRTRRLAVTANPWRKYNLQLDAEFVADDLRNQIGALPLPSPAVVAAFPGRFQRDSSGTLILVDNRSVNFARQKNERLRLAVRFAVPLTHSVVEKGARGPGYRRGPGTRLEVSGSHTILLKSVTVIRKGLGEIDLLAGGTIGIGGGLQRHSTNASIALTRGATGLRLEASRRGGSILAAGTPTAPNLLTFRALTTVNLKAIADLGQLLPKVPFAKDARLTLSFNNLFNQRQRVTNGAGEIPQAYQPILRDPIGRTFKVEFRKVF